MNNHHKTERQSWTIQETTQIIKIQGYVHFFLKRVILINSVIILSCEVYKHLLCEIAYSGEY